jgi:peptide/nickel transport system permease protein
MSVSVSVPETVEVAQPRRAGIVGRVAGHYLVRRMTKAAVTVWLVVTLTFFLIHLMPGNPVDSFIEQQMTQYGMSYAAAKSQAASLFSIDLSRPLPLQYLDFLGGLAHGDLGKSLVNTGTPVSTEVLQYLPWTLFCVGVGLLISFMLGSALGMVMAYRRESALDHVLSAAGSLLSSIQNYILATLIIAFLGVQWNLVPFAQMRGTLSPGVTAGFSLGFIGDAFYHGALPISVYVLSTIGTWMLTMKSSTISALGEDYVTVARARGLRHRRIVSAYVGRNAILPVFTQLAITIGFAIGSAAPIEQVFQYQGVGFLLLASISQRDYTVMQAIFMIITISVVFSNLAADLLYSKLDPRITVAGRGGGE